MKMKLGLVISLTALLAASTAQGQSRYPPDPVCDCGATEVVRPDGTLNMRHCSATRVLSVLDRYAGRSAELLPDRVTPLDLEVMARKLDQQRREAARALLQLMTADDLARFAPFLINADPPGRRAGGNPGTWQGRASFSCSSAVYWINEGLDRAAEVSATLVSLLLETQMYDANPALFCNPAYLSDSIYYGPALQRFGETWDWLQLAADHMTDGNPALASIASFAAQWQSFLGSLSFVIAYTQPPISGASQCEEVSIAGLKLSEVGAAARQAYEQADACAQGR